LGLKNPEEGKLDFFPLFVLEIGISKIAVKKLRRYT